MADMYCARCQEAIGPGHRLVRTAGLSANGGDETYHPPCFDIRATQAKGTKHTLSISISLERNSDSRIPEDRCPERKDEKPCGCHWKRMPHGWGGWYYDKVTCDGCRPVLANPYSPDDDDSRRRQSMTNRNVCKNCGTLEDANKLLVAERYRLRDYITVALTCPDPMDVKALLGEALATPSTEPKRRDRHDSTILSKIRNRDRGHA